MDLHVITRMSYWYPLLRDYTIESYSYRCPDKLVLELGKAFLLAMEGDPFMVARKLLRKYGELREFLQKYISRWGGLFIRGDLASPKDACLEISYFLDNPLEHGLVVIPRTQYNACISLRPETALALIIYSERVMNIGDPRILWVRKPTMLRDEVRVFVKDRTPRLISWYYPEEPLKRNKKPAIFYRMKDLNKLIEKVCDKTGLENYVLDVGFSRRELVIVELTPFPSRENPYMVDPIMFRRDFWDKLGEAEEKNTTIIRYPVYMENGIDLLYDADSGEP